MAAAAAEKKASQESIYDSFLRDILRRGSSDKSGGSTSGTGSSCESGSNVASGSIGGSNAEWGALGAEMKLSSLEHSTWEGGMGETTGKSAQALADLRLLSSTGSTKQWTQDSSETGMAAASHRPRGGTCHQLVYMMAVGAEHFDTYPSCLGRLGSSFCRAAVRTLTHPGLLHGLGNLLLTLTFSVFLLLLLPGNLYAEVVLQWVTLFSLILLRTAELSLVAPMMAFLSLLLVFSRFETQFQGVAYQSWAMFWSQVSVFVCCLLCCRPAGSICCAASLPLIKLTHTKPFAPAYCPCKSWSSVCCCCSWM